MGSHGRAVRIAFQTRSGVAGSSICSTPGLANGRNLDRHDCGTRSLTLKPVIISAGSVSRLSARQLGAKPRFSPGAPALPKQSLSSRRNLARNVRFPRSRLRERDSLRTIGSGAGALGWGSASLARVREVRIQMGGTPSAAAEPGSDRIGGGSIVFNGR